ncbi:hypothetical protein ABDK56_05440 [Sphingomonas sp. ASV193]|uniref:hypothetical protein n=1 Tax=Sphingomonas sp. ASV193 TaxID=3144405 RepID=UPI0032E8DC96
MKAALRALALASMLASAGCARPAPPRAKPALALLTSLPILFPERFGLGRPAGAAVAERLERDFRLMPIAASDTASLDGQRLLLMIQPRAQTAENLVALDDWMRGGGRAMLLADPRLDWPSDKPLGDLTRPPMAFPDTGLLLHWGVRLDDSGTSAGRLVATGPGCAVEAEGARARCRIGRGEAVIVADADAIDPRRQGSAAATDALVTLLKALATPR